jgi:hypothetical protein
VKVSDRRLLAACIKLKKASVMVTRINPTEYQFKKEFLLRLKAEMVPLKETGLFISHPTHAKSRGWGAEMPWMGNRPKI